MTEPVGAKIYAALHADMLKNDKGMTVLEIVAATGYKEGRVRRALNEVTWVATDTEWRDSYSTAYRMMQSGSHKVTIYKLRRSELIRLIPRLGEATP
jgi:protein-L-isoaspartate O-methyltransferase